MIKSKFSEEYSSRQDAQKNDGLYGLWVFDFDIFMTNDELALQAAEIYTIHRQEQCSWLK